MLNRYIIISIVLVSVVWGSVSSAPMFCIQGCSKLGTEFVWSSYLCEHMCHSGINMLSSSLFLCYFMLLCDLSMNFNRSLQWMIKQDRNAPILVIRVIWVYGNSRQSLCCSPKIIEILLIHFSGYKTKDINKAKIKV